VFFLGLLSTPLPYLLLAAFYFFGFAMGMFNNSTGEETTEQIAAVTIPVEVKQKSVEPAIYFYQISSSQTQIPTSSIIIEEDTSFFYPDSGKIIYPLTNCKIHEFLYSGFQFSRPPPSIC
jgi:hypothetical protein